MFYICLFDVILPVGDMRTKHVGVLMDCMWMCIF